MDKLRSIVVGVDFSPASAAALRQAERLALWSKADVHPVHIAQPPADFIPDPVIYPLPPLPAEDVVAEAKAAWAGFALDVPERRKLAFDIIVGQPQAELRRFCREREADLLILGAGADHGVGTFAAACIRHPSSKVLIVREQSACSFGHIAVGVDFSRNSARALEAAARFAAQDSADLRIIHVFHFPWKSSADASAGRDDAVLRDCYRESLAKHLRVFCEKTIEEMAYLRPRYELHCDTSAGRGLLAATSGSADLVVVGTHGRAHLRDLILGRTTDRLLRETRSSLLVVPDVSR